MHRPQYIGTYVSSIFPYSMTSPFKAGCPSPAICLISVRAVDFGESRALPALTMSDQPGDLTGDHNSIVVTLAELQMASTDRDVPDDSVPAGEVLPAKELLRSSQPPSGKVKKHLSDLCNDVWNYILDYV